MQEKPKTVAIYTLGCKLNTYDSEYYREQFESQGYRVVPFGEAADVTVVNTCTVTGEGDAQSRQMLRKAHRVSPEGSVVAVGCYAQTDPDRLIEMPEVDLVVGMAEKSGLIDLVNDTCSTGNTCVTRGRAAEFHDMDIVNFGGRARAFVKVQEGCNEFCSFCIIPFARGRSRSRGLDSTVAQVRRLVDAGYQEVVLTGVHLGDYAAGGAELLDVLEAVDAIPGLGRFRVSSLEATYIPDAMVDFFARSEKFCRHLHIPLQSGDDGVLEAMRRPYRRDQYIDLVNKIADRVPGIGLGADVMVGFPGESDAAFESTCNLVEQSPISYLHVFPYSPRQATPATRMPGQVPPQVKKSRGAHLRSLGSEKARAFHRRFLGETRDVLLEGRRETGTGHLQGLTDNYIRVFTAAPDEAMDRLTPVRLERAAEDGRVLGSIVHSPVPTASKATVV